MKAQTALKIAAGTLGAATAATFAAGELLYEGVLNIKLSQFFSEKLNLSNPDMTVIFENNPECVDGASWIEEQNLTELVLHDAKGTSAHGYIIKQEKPSNKWVISAHGYTSQPKDHGAYSEHFYKMGYNIALPCMRGHEHDEHRYSSMGYYDKYIVKEWIKYLVDTYPDCEIVLHGVSMGSATVMLTTGLDLPENVKCAVSDCGYTNVWDEYVRQLEEMFHLPAFPILYATNEISKLRGNFDFKKCSPVDAVAHSKTPTLFIHGEKDTFVPYEMLDKVFSACSAEKEKLSIPDAIHATSAYVNPKLYWDTVTRFTEKYI